MKTVASLQDVLIDMVLSINELTKDERGALITSIAGVPFHLMTAPDQAYFKAGIKKFLEHNTQIKRYYERW